jgi:hypothetical protein
MNLPIRPFLGKLGQEAVPPLVHDAFELAVGILEPELRMDRKVVSPLERILWYLARKFEDEDLTFDVRDGECFRVDTLENSGERLDLRVEARQHEGPFCLQGISLVSMWLGWWKRGLPKCLLSLQHDSAFSSRRQHYKPSSWVEPNLSRLGPFPRPRLRKQ